MYPKIVAYITVSELFIKLNIIPLLRCRQVLQYLPITHKHSITLKETEKQQDDDLQSARIPSKYSDDFFDESPSPTPTASKMRASSLSGDGDAKAPTPPPFNPSLQLSRPLPNSQAQLAMSSVGELPLS